MTAAFPIAQETLESAAEARWEWAGYALSDPWFLLCIPLAIGAALVGSAAKRYAPGRVPSIGTQLPRSLRQRMLWVPDAVRFIAVVLVVLALARPLRGDVELTSTSEGVDIVMLLDRSSSMEKRENPGRQSPRRFDVARAVMSAFATRRMNDVEGASDNVGLIGFAKYPELLCPFTLDSDALNGVLAEIDTVRRRDMDGTGIGLAVAKAVDVLKNSEAESRVVILLTDGEETIGKIMPMAAAQMAAEEGVKLYSVFAGPKFVVRATLRSSQPRIRVPVPVGDLPEMAKMTGGKFFHAETAEELEDVYEAIEELERTEREEQRFAEHFDLYRAVPLPGDPAVPVRLALDIHLGPEVAVSEPGFLGFEILRPTYTVLLAFVPLLLVLGFMALAARRRGLRQIVHERHATRFLPGYSVTRARLRVLFACAAVLFLGLSMLGPVRGFTLREVERKGLDLVVCLDTSRSMLVEDKKPNRLERAKDQIRLLLDKLGNDRAALLAFSGDVRREAPLTRDRQTMRWFLDSASPSDNLEGGTDLGGALEAALELFDGRTGAHEAIILLTDGEDLQERGLEVAEEAAKRGIRIYVVGMGTRSGGKIPTDRGGFVRDEDGQEVVSALDGTTLEAIAAATDGAYLSIEDHPLPLEEIYQKRISHLEGRSLENGKERIPHDRYQWPLVLALLCMLGETSLRERRSKDRRSTEGKR